MKVYHTSKTEVSHPDVSLSREGLDFGKGFYVTRLREQAESYSKRFTLRGQPAILNIYEMDLDFPMDIRHKKFDSYDEEWLDFVIANRSGKRVEEYDIIEGGVANDKVFRTLDLFFSGDISKSDALGRLKYEKPNHQICIRKQWIADSIIHFINSITL